ncbi:50S ribosomal protein L25/general stress protein Ctc [Celerinatantimonas sp. YJH-8]|uniref:50S ribosomal protein L25/general stress protein Ctc n=1 Tax=Celerinatantimonas sp. YJH-8 TaxID=3228714 RepID=UPI0038C84BCB
MSKIVLNAELRSELGKGASRRLRREDKVPAILYGAGKEAVSLTLVHDKVIQAQENEAFYSQILELKVGGESVDVLVKAMQRHAFKPKVTHIDFLRVNASETLTTTVPVHYLNEETSVAISEGAIIHHHATEIEVSCLPKDIPEFIAVDVAQLANGESIHLSHITLPEGVISTALARGEEHDLVLVSAAMERGSLVADDEADAPAADAADEAPTEE